LEDYPLSLDVNSNDLVAVGNISGTLAFFDHKTKKVESISEGKAKINSLNWNLKEVLLFLEY
jgi:hypothetical protein